MGDFLELYFMVLSRIVFLMKNMFFCEELFRLDQTPIIEGQGPIWRIAGPAKTVKMDPGEEKKDAAKNNVTN